jgi:hypothetical protein
MGTDISYFAERRTERGWEHCLVDFYCGEERNYALFAILAGVARLTNSGFEPIVPPRGFPADSPAVSHLAGVPETPSCHNATWLALKELLDFPWHQKQWPCTGYVDAEEFLHFRIAGRPQHLSTQSGTVVSNGEMERRINGGTNTAGLLTLVSFGIPYAEFAGPFVTETLPLLSQQGPPDEVGLILSFDS